MTFLVQTMFAILTLIQFNSTTYAANSTDNIFKMKLQNISGGSNTGGALSGSSSDLINWCRGITGKLRYFLDQSELTLQINESEAAFNILRDGMIQVARTPEGTAPDYTLMYIALQRGLAIAAALKDRTMLPYVSSNSAYWVMQNYYTFLIDKVSQADIDYFIPFYTCLNCGPHNIEEEKKFEQRYIKYAQEALKWLNRDFIHNSPERGPSPISSPKLYLKLAEYIASNAIIDLTNPQSIWQNKYACVIENLKLLEQSIIEHNMGNRTIYGTDRIAVIRISSQINRLSQEFSNIDGNVSGNPTSGGFCR